MPTVYQVLVFWFTLLNAGTQASFIYLSIDLSRSFRDDRRSEAAIYASIAAAILYAGLTTLMSFWALWSEVQPLLRLASIVDIGFAALFFFIGIYVLTKVDLAKDEVEGKIDDIRLALGLDSFACGLVSVSLGVCEWCYGQSDRVKLFTKEKRDNAMSACRMYCGCIGN